MFSYIKNLYIMDIGGIIVFKINQKDDFNTELFGGFMNAINSFAKQITHSQIDSIILKDERYYLLKKNKMTFIVSADKDEKEKKVESELKKIMEIFFDKYDITTLNHWDGNSSLFKDFKKVLEEKFLKSLKVLNNGLW